VFVSSSIRYHNQQSRCSHHPILLYNKETDISTFHDEHFVLTVGDTAKIAAQRVKRVSGKLQTIDTVTSRGSLEPNPDWLP
jgi:hypothetical protein